MANWKNWLGRLAVVMVMMTCIAGVLNYADNYITEHNRKTLRNDLRMVMDQNVETTSQVMEKYFLAVHRVAAHLNRGPLDEARVTAVIMRQSEIQKLLNFVRVGFIYPDGRAFGSDGERGNLAVRDYFHRSMRGEDVVTHAMQSYLGKEHVLANVFSTPVYKQDGTIGGVAFITVPNKLLVEYMHKGVLAEYGTSAIVDNNGDLIAADAKSTLEGKDSDLLGFVTLDSGNTRLANSFEEGSLGQSQSMYFERDGGKYLYFALVPMHEKATPIYAAMLLDQAFLYNQTKNFTTDVHHLMWALLGIALAGGAFFVWDNHRRDERIRKDLEYMAYTSKITEGANLDKFYQVVLDRKCSGYLVYMDIRDFEIIRSVIGVKSAEKLLKEVWQVIEHWLHTNECGGHINNDSYALFIAEENLEKVAKRLEYLNISLNELATAENVPALKGCYGLAAYKVGEEVELCCSNANLAHTSIMASQNRYYAVYGKEVTQEFMHNKELEQSFAENIRERRFEVWYQPKVDCFTNAVVGAEALVRLRDKEGKLVPPNQFIPLFERDGLIRLLDEYVFETVCEQHSRRKKQGEELVPVSVNLSRASLYYANIADVYANILSKWGVASRYVPLEITESAMANNQRMREMANSFTSWGFKLHLDDFGSGYSSMALLNELNFDNIKIDKSLIDYIGEEKGDNLLRHIVKLSKELGMKVTAEGVENMQQVEFLKSIDCHCIQGYFYSKPLPYEEFVAFVQAHKVASL